MKTNEISVPFGTNYIKNNVSLKIVFRYYSFNNSFPNLIQNTDILYQLIQYIVRFIYNLFIFYFIVVDKGSLKQKIFPLGLLGITPTSAL